MQARPRTGRHCGNDQLGPGGPHRLIRRHDGARVRRAPPTWQLRLGGWPGAPRTPKSPSPALETLTFRTTGSPSRPNTPIRPSHRVFGTCQSYAGPGRGRTSGQSRTRRLLVAGGTHSHANSHDTHRPNRWTHSGPGDGRPVRVRAPVDRRHGRRGPNGRRHAAAAGLGALRPPGVERTGDGGERRRSRSMAGCRGRIDQQHGGVQPLQHEAHDRRQRGSDPRGALGERVPRLCQLGRPAARRR